MTDQTRLFLLHPFRTPRLSGAQIGWGRPLAAVLIALLIPAVLSIVFLYAGAPSLHGPPKDGTSYTLRDHIDMFSAALAASLVVSWMIAPFALIALRASALLGWAGWGTALLTALAFGLPTVHFALNGDVTTEDSTILPHILLAICTLGLSVWAAFWGLIRVQRIMPEFSR